MPLRVGDGEDITAVVMVKGSAVGNPPQSRGRVYRPGNQGKAAAKGLQCTSDSKVAMITIQEGYKAGIMSGCTAKDCGYQADGCHGGDGRRRRGGDTVLVSFMGIPEGVSVMVPDEVGLAKMMMALQQMRWLNRSALY